MFSFIAKRKEAKLLSEIAQLAVDFDERRLHDVMDYPPKTQLSFDEIRDWMTREDRRFRCAAMLACRGRNTPKDIVRLGLIDPDIYVQMYARQFCKTEWLEADYKMTGYVSVEELMTALDAEGEDVCANVGDDDCDWAFSRELIQRIVSKLPKYKASMIAEDKEI